MHDTGPSQTSILLTPNKNSEEEDEEEDKRMEAQSQLVPIMLVVLDQLPSEREQACLRAGPTEL